MSAQQDKAAPSKVRVFLGNAGTFLGSVIGGLIRAILYWKEATIVLPLVILAVVFLCLWVISLTNSQLTNNIGSLIDTGFTLSRIAAVVVLTGATQKALFGYRSEAKGDDNKTYPLKDDIHDSCVTAFLLLLFSALVFYF